MMDANAVIEALKKEFPAPNIDPQWVRECMQALLDDGQDATLHAVREQYLFSDLAQSTIPTTNPLIPPNAHKIRLFPRPTLLQIISMTEIGSSAFQLQTVAEQRKDIINGTTLIRRMDDELDDDEEEQIKEGKMPVYPRGMLKFELTLGDGRVVDAIEYKKIPGILLGETSLGAKMKMKNVKVLRGILMLDPTDTEFLGYQVDHLEAEQGARFLDGLAQRLDKPVSNQPRPVARPRARPTATIAPISTAPRRAIAPATTGPRQNQTRLSFSPEKSDIEIVDDIIPMAGSSSNFRRMSPPLSARRPARAAATSASARVSNLYTQSAQVDLAMAPPAGSKRARDDGSIHSLDDDDSMDFDDSFLRQIDAAEARAGRPMDNFINDEEEEEEEEDDWDDSSFIRQVDEVEKQAQARPPAKTSRFFPPQNGRNGGQSSRKPVYVVDSDGGSGKENCEPDIVYISD